MELWIRSQDRRILQKVDNVYLNANYKNRRICTNDSRDYESDLGTYATKKRALEVLDEIQNILKAKCILKSYDNITPEFSEKAIIQPCEVHIEQLDNYVYEMPKE